MEQADANAIIIVDANGAEHEFPAGFDPKRAAAIVRQQEQEAAIRRTYPQLPPDWPRDRFGHPLSTADHPLDEDGRPVHWADRTFTPENLDRAQIAADLITPVAGIIGGPKPMGGLRLSPRGGVASALKFTGEAVKNYDITHPAKPIGTMLKWAGDKLTPTPTEPAPQPFQVPVERGDLLQRLRLRQADVANAAPAVSERGPAPSPPPPLPAPPPMDRDSLLQQLRQQQIREAAALPPVPQNTTPAAPPQTPPRLPAGKLTGEKAPTLEETLVEALLQSRNPPPTSVTLPPHVPTPPGGAASRPPITIVETPATQRLMTDPTTAPTAAPVGRPSPKVDVEGNITPSKSKRGASATAGLSEGDMRRLGLDPAIRLIRATPDTLREIELLRAQARDGYISAAELAKRAQDALAQDQP